ncbi:SDR family oxidoreductase [Lacisediminihabitans profunda]|uniref:SDR family oxidoreductase n=1 Tax=Lacisediminihabitans profunda TaxID=2594790 RepID=A0A5C8UJ47_9MICO|nr:SDR family oxidoreductase [Lacisediminihabitans profunda]TXN28355.1 SDR family oxidoreductase [Lacisediminihabitans profunda]
MPIDTPSRRLVITGGSSGLGAEVVTRALFKGWEVTVIDRNPSEKAPTVLADLSDTAAAFAAGEEAIGDGRAIDALVLCAGINIPGMFEEQDIETWSKPIAVNLLGNAAVARAGISALKAAKGRLVGIGSTAGRRITPGMSAYGVSKHAFRAMFHALSLELNGVIPISLVNPGTMDTNFFDGRPERFTPSMDRMAPGNVADTVMFCLEQPSSVVIRELYVTDVTVHDWP